MPRLLCDPAAAILQGMADRARQMDMPALEFANAPIAQTVDVIMRQLVVMGATIPLSDAPGAAQAPAVVITGLDQHGNQLPRWTYSSTRPSVERAREVFNRQIDLALRAATL